MGFATVKSDPYKKGMKPRRRKMLWSDEFWKRLCNQAMKDAAFGVEINPRRIIETLETLETLDRKSRPDVSQNCQAMIREMNDWILHHA